MSFRNLRASVSVLAAAMLPLGQVSAWFMGVGHLPSCAYICLDRSVSLQSSCQDLKCICKQPNLLASNEACFRQECDLNSLSKALKLLATCQESFGVTPTRDSPVQSPSTPPTAPSPLPATGYSGYPYTPAPPTANQPPAVSYYPYPYPRVPAPVNQSNATQPPPGASPEGSPLPGAGGPQSQVSPPPNQPSPLPPQVSNPTSQAPTPIGGVINGTTNSTTPHPPTSASPSPLFPPRLNSSASAAGDAAFASAQSLFRNHDSCIFLSILLSSLVYL